MVQEAPASWSSGEARRSRIVAGNATISPKTCTPQWLIYTYINKHKGCWEWQSCLLVDLFAASYSRFFFFFNLVLARSSSQWSQPPSSVILYASTFSGSPKRYSKSVSCKQYFSKNHTTYTHNLNNHLKFGGKELPGHYGLGFLS